MAIINPDDPDQGGPGIPQGLPPQPQPQPVPVPQPAPNGLPDIAPYLSNPNQDAQPVPPDAIGDIPPPPVPRPPRRGPRVPVAGEPPPTGPAGGETFARPASVGIRPYRTPTAAAPRFGPGVPVVGAGTGGGLGDLGLSPDEADELLRGMVGGL